MMTEEQRAFVLGHIDLDRIRERYERQAITPMLLIMIEAVANSDLRERWEEIEAGWFRRWPDPPSIDSVRAVLRQPMPDEIEIGLAEDGAFMKVRIEAEP